MTRPIQIVAPVVPKDGAGNGQLQRYLFSRHLNATDKAITAWFADPGQEKPFSVVATNLRALEAARLGDGLPEHFDRRIDVTVLGSIDVSGNSTMLAAAAGFVAARAVKDGAALGTLVATGTLGFDTGLLPIGEAVRVSPVARLPSKLAAILDDADLARPLLVAIPASDHDDDLPYQAQIDGLIDVLRQRGDTVLRVPTLAILLAHWIPGEAWQTPELAAQYAAINDVHPPPPPINQWRRWLPLVVGAAALTIGVAYTYPRYVVPSSAAAKWAADLILADPDQHCGAEVLYVEHGPGRDRERSAAAAGACAALAACDAAAGHALDPDRQAAGRKTGVGFEFLRDAPRAAVARRACDEALRLADGSAKARWHLSRVLEAQGESTAADTLRQDAAARGEPMARLRQAEDLLVAGEAAAARAQLRLLADRPHSVPQAVYVLAGLLRCGVGGDPEPHGSMAQAGRLRDLARDYAGNADFPDRALSLATAITAAADDPAVPAWCPDFRHLNKPGEAR